MDSRRTWDGLPLHPDQYSATCRAPNRHFCASWPLGVADDRRFDRRRPRSRVVMGSRCSARSCPCAGDPRGTPAERGRACHRDTSHRPKSGFGNVEPHVRPFPRYLPDSEVFEYLPFAVPRVRLVIRVMSSVIHTARSPVRPSHLVMPGLSIGETRDRGNLGCPNRGRWTRNTAGDPFAVIWLGASCHRCRRPDPEPSLP